MKKMFKVIATVAAILSMANFVACKSDDDGDDEKVAVTSVTLDQTTASVEAGKTVTLKATVAPDNATNKTVSWTSSDTAVATVADGVVTGVAAGEATITATADGKSAAAAITVTAASTDGGSGDSGSSETTSKTAAITYDGSAESNAPAESGDTGVFASVQTDLADAGVSSKFELASVAWSTQSYNSGANEDSGIIISSDALTAKVALDADETIAWASYTFTLNSKADVIASTSGFNTQSGNLYGKVEILSGDTVKMSKTASSGSKTDNGVTGESVELEAGTYTLKYSWVTTKAYEATSGLKKVTCGVKGFSISATTK